MTMFSRVHFYPDTTYNWAYLVESTEVNLKLHEIEPQLLKAIDAQAIIRDLPLKSLSRWLPAI